MQELCRHKELVLFGLRVSMGQTGRLTSPRTRKLELRSRHGEIKIFPRKQFYPGNSVWYKQTVRFNPGNPRGQCYPVIFNVLCTYHKSILPFKAALLSSVFYAITVGRTQITSTRSLRCTLPGVS